MTMISSKLIDYEAIVIGAGPAGLSAAHRLVSKGVRTLLINATTKNGQGLGGLANDWHFQCAELEDVDFEGTSDFSTWPISHSEYRKYTELAKNILNIEVNKNNETLNNLTYSCADEVQVVEVETVIAQKQKWEKLFQSTILNPKLTITNGFINKLNHDNQSLTGIVMDGEQLPLSSLSKIYLAAGCVGNTEILSRSKFENLNKSSIFSKYLADHPMFENIYLTGGNRNSFHELFENKKTNTRTVLIKRKYRVRKNRKNLGVFEIRHFFSKKSINHTDHRLTLSESTKILINKASKFLFNRIVFRPLITKVWIQLAQGQNFNSQITFSDNSTSIHWLLSEEDLDNYLQIINAVENYAERNGYSLGYLNEVKSVQDLQDAAQPAFHLSGTTRMSKTLVNSVVDSNGQLLDIKNCFVLGSSIFTTPGWANPTLSIMALSIRTVDKSH